MTAELTASERDLLLSPCGCGHTINDHGTMVACWRCEDDGAECAVAFEGLLVERVGRMVALRTAQGAPAEPATGRVALGATDESVGAQNGSTEVLL